MNLIRRPWFVWGCLGLIACTAIAASAMSPLLAWRQPIYILGSFAGIVALALLLFQPLLMHRQVPGLTILQGRKIHRWVGVLLLLSVAIHVLALWLTSPPDVIDALLFRSPTLFAPWGVVAMWAVLISALIVAARRRIRFKTVTWQRLHRCLAVVIVVGSVVHAYLIEGAMETWSKWALCIAVIVATSVTLITRNKWPQNVSDDALE